MEGYIKEYTLKNGKELTIRSPKPEDAKELIRLVQIADAESRFLAREPGEFQVSEQREEEMIREVNASSDSAWFTAEYEGRLVGQSSIALVRDAIRYRHRAGVAFLVTQECWGMGIGGKMMEACINWAEENQIERLELDVVFGNDRAIRLYESFGFEKYGRVHHSLKYADGTYADEYLMEKWL